MILLPIVIDNDINDAMITFLLSKKHIKKRCSESLLRVSINITKTSLEIASLLEFSRYANQIRRSGSLAKRVISQRET